MSEWNKQDKEVLDGILERIEDARLRYFFLMLGSAIADYCEQQKSDHIRPPDDRGFPTPAN